MNEKWPTSFMIEKQENELRLWKISEYISFIQDWEVWKWTKFMIEKYEYKLMFMIEK
jgi:hypothetical protein